MLQAATFASGRLTNPPHVMSDHFETYHVLQRPTYTSKFPPADAGAMALGLAFAGRPVVGVWLAMAFGCGAVSWMLAAFVPLEWALAGGVLTCVHPTVVELGQMYLGGGLALAGGALVVGAAWRLMQRMSVRNSVVLGAGMSLLASSRPYEGAVLSTCVLLTVVAGIARSRTHSMRELIVVGLLPMAVVLAVTASWMLYYDSRITGHATLMPYQLYESTRGRTEIFFWRGLNDHVKLLDGSMLRFAEWEETLWKLHQTPIGLAVGTFYKTRNYLRAAFGSASTRFFVPDRTSMAGRFFDATTRLFPMAIAYPLVALPWTLRSRRDTRWALALLAVFGVALVLPIFDAPRYAMPAGGLVILLVVTSLRQLCATRGFGVALGALCIAVWSITLTGFSSDVRDRNDFFYQGAAVREKLTRALMAKPGKDLVIVHYAPQHNPHVEFVWNEPDIDAAQIVWARSLGAARDEELRRYYADRFAWDYYPDLASTALKPAVPPMAASPQRVDGSSRSK